MMVTAQPDYLPYARSALAQYPLHNPGLTFLGHSDNLTFRVDDPGGAVYLLRLHTPVVSFLHGIRQQPEAIASELTWMEALALEGGFTIQKPVHTYNGSLVGSVEIEGAVVPCTLLTWLEGEHFSLNGQDANEILRGFGALVARMHNFSTQWQPPAGFLRPSYDDLHFRRVFGRFSRGVDLGVYSEVIYRQLHVLGQAILSEIQNLPTDPEHWGVTHNDLHVGNFLVNQGQVIPIDFSFCGFAHYLFDISIPLAGGMKASLRPIFLDGYNSIRPLVQADIRVIEAYALAGRISYYAYQIDNPAEHDWLRRRIPQMLENEGAALLRREPLLMKL
jgi:Ser/Thr protein kinase RdoA (MazF antagonist)